MAKYTRIKNFYVNGDGPYDGGITIAPSHMSLEGAVDRVDIRISDPAVRLPDRCPASALARAVMLTPSDRTTICALMDACQEWLGHAPDAEAERERVLAEVKEIKNAPRESFPRAVVNGPEYLTHKILMDKLRDLGYGAAVDEYLKPAGSTLTSLPGSYRERYVDDTHYVVPIDRTEGRE